jgi:hypothetical protein
MVAARSCMQDQASLETSSGREPKGRAVSKNSPHARTTRIWAAIGALLLVSGTVGLSASTAGAAGSNTLSVTAGEYVYQLKGAPKSGWTQIDFKNAGVEDHMLAMVKLKSGVTAKQLKAAAVSSDQAAFGKIADPKADPNGVSGVPQLIGPGQQTSTMTQLAAGHYGIMCFVPAASDGKPHVAHGMVKVFDVSSAKSSLKPPTDGVQDVTLTDTAIQVPAGNPGRQVTLKVTNSGTTPHNFTFVKVNPGQTLDAVKAYFDAFFGGQAPAGGPPGVIVGGVSDISPGASAYLVQSLAPGHYGYVSTDGDLPNDDYTKGMHGEFDVK